MRGIIGWAWPTFWDMGSGQELFTLHGHSGTLLHMIFSADGTRLITSADHLGCGPGCCALEPSPSLVGASHSDQWQQGERDPRRSEHLACAQDGDSLWSDRTMIETPSRNARRTQRFHTGKCSQRHRLTRCVFGGGSRTPQTTFDRLEFIGSEGVWVLLRSDLAVQYARPDSYSGSRKARAGSP